MKIEIRLIRSDGGTQTRAVLDQATLAEYEQAWLDGAEFPPVVVFHDGTEYWLADGFHRVRSAVMAGLAGIEAEVRQGTRRDAVLFSVGANADHGLRRSNADKRRAVELLLRDGEWAAWSDREIARRCNVTHPFVAALREELARASGNGYQMERRFQRGGETYTMRTENIGAAAERLSAPGADSGSSGATAAQGWQADHVSAVGQSSQAGQDAQANQVGQIGAVAPVYHAGQVGRPGGNDGGLMADLAPRSQSVGRMELGPVQAGTRSPSGADTDAVTRARQAIAAELAGVEAPPAAVNQAAVDESRQSGRCPACGKTPWGYSFTQDRGWTCSYCSAVVVLTAVTPQAGGTIEMSKCPACGKPVMPGAAFCRNCGAEV